MASRRMSTVLTVKTDLVSPGQRFKPGSVLKMSGLNESGYVADATGAGGIFQISITPGQKAKTKNTDQKDINLTLHPYPPFPMSSRRIMQADRFRFRLSERGKDMISRWNMQVIRAVKTGGRSECSDGQNGGSLSSEPELDWLRNLRTNLEIPR